VEGRAGEDGGAEGLRREIDRVKKLNVSKAEVP
jgi:hypothetical protein